MAFSVKLLLEGNLLAAHSVSYIIFNWFLQFQLCVNNAIPIRLKCVSQNISKSILMSAIEYEFVGWLVFFAWNLNFKCFDTKLNKTERENEKNQRTNLIHMTHGFMTTSTLDKSFEC